jgi:hypothetical protein
MLVSKKFLRVVPNPFAAPLDHEGRPCGAVQYDPEHSRFVRYIGATRADEVLEKRPANDLRGHRVDVRWVFDLAPVDIEDTNYHRGMIASGELFAADESTAKRGGLKVLAPFADALRVARSKAIDAWTKDHDGDAPPVAEWRITGLAAAVPADKGAVK